MDWSICIKSFQVDLTFQMSIFHIWSDDDLVLQQSFGLLTNKHLIFSHGYLLVFIS